MDRDSYWPGARGEDEFLADARALLAAVRAYAELDRAIAVNARSADSQRLFEATRRGLAASAVDELGAACDLLADVAHEFAAPIETDLRDARRLIDMIWRESTGHELATPRPITARLAELSAARR